MMTKHELEKIVKQEKKAVLVVNASSRKGRRLFSNAVTVLTDRGLLLTAAHRVRNPIELPGLVKREIDRGSRMIIVGGGDGTISALVDYLAYRDVVFGLLPLGTANSFARTLGIPLTLEGAGTVIADGKVADIDLGKVNADYFANMASVGFTADVARSTPGWLKRLIGHAAYSVSGAALFFTTKKFHCQLTVGDSRHSVETHLVIVANGSFFGIADLSPEAHIESRQLFIITMNMMTRRDLLRFWISFVLRKRRGAEDIKYFTSKTITIETDPPRYIDIDGEARTRTPATISLAPDALKVMVPSEFKERMR